MLLSIQSSAGSMKVEVATFAEASRDVRAFIDRHGLGSGCANNGWAFKRATITDKRKKVATVSYNGRVWNIDGTEIK